MRIVSLLPSATEIVCELGLGEQLVGVSHECDYPPPVRELPKVTRTLIPSDASSHAIDEQVRRMVKSRKSLYSLDESKLEELRPDLIVTQALCNVCAVADDEVHAAADRLQNRPRIVNLEPTRLDEVFQALQLVGDAAGAAQHAQQVVARLEHRVLQVADRSSSIARRPRVVMLEWIDPPFCAGHWSPELVRLAGGIECIGRESQPSRRIEWDEVLAANPEVLLIACCGFDVARTMRDTGILATQRDFHELDCVRNQRVYVADGNAYFNRPGPRLVDSLELLAHALQPSIHPLENSGLTPFARWNAADRADKFEADE